VKFSIEIDEFWLEDEDLSEALQAHIKRSVVTEISDNIKEEVETKITEKVTEVINDKVAQIIDSTLTDLIATGTILKNKESISIVSHVKDLFMRNSGWSNANSHIERIAKRFGEELKLQYNNVFANRIVQNMKEQGLLKDEVVKILLEDK